jgi:hypothetical protein
MSCPAAAQTGGRRTRRQRGKRSTGRSNRGGGLFDFGQQNQAIGPDGRPIQQSPFGFRMPSFFDRQQGQQQNSGYFGNFMDKLPWNQQGQTQAPGFMDKLPWNQQGQTQAPGFMGNQQGQPQAGFATPMQMNPMRYVGGRRSRRTKTRKSRKSRSRKSRK